MSADEKAKTAENTSAFPYKLLLLFSAVHGGLLLFDISSPTAFYAGDRAVGRIDKIYALFGPYLGPHTPSIDAFVLPHGMTFIDRLLTLSSPGDYLIHGALYVAGGQYLVVLTQLCLMFFSVLAVLRLAQLAELNGSVPSIVAIIYMLLPTSLMAPHTLATEALFSPLSTIALYLFIRATDRELRLRVLYFSLALMSLCIFIRLQLLLFPFFIAAILLLLDRARVLKTLPPLLTVPFILPLAWTVFAAASGSGGEGAADNSVLLEFYKITKRVSAAEGFAFDPSAYPDARMQPGEFLGYLLAHPAAFLKIKGGDVINMLVNPGVNSFFGRYIGLFGIDDGDGTPLYRGYWRDLRDQVGLLGVVTEIVRSRSAFAVTFIAAGAVWAAVLLGAALGLWGLLRHSALRWSSRLILLAYPVYTVAILLVANTNRWDHRSPFDFVVALLFGFGVQLLITGGRRTRNGSDIPSHPGPAIAVNTAARRSGE